MNGLLSKIRVDCTRAVAEKRCEMMNLSRLTTLENQCHRGTLLRLYKMLLQSRYGKQGRNRNTVFIDVTVGQDDDIHTIAVCTVNLKEESLNRLLKRSILIVSDRNRLNLESRLVHVFDLQQIGTGQNRILHFQDVAVARLLLEDISLLTDIDGCRSAGLLPEQRAV